MKHARPDYDSIQDTTAAQELATLILSLTQPTELTPDMLARAQLLAQEVLGKEVPSHVTVTTNGTTRLIPADEPVFLIRGQDAVGAEAVRAWAALAEANGAKPDILHIARDHARKMDAWPKKKTADVPATLSS